MLQYMILKTLDESGHPSSIFPQRPGVPDCLHYVRTGMCHYGMDCRFNHTPKRMLEEALGRKDDYPEQEGQPECQFYLKTGTCKFGSTCKYHHPRDKAGIMGKVLVNTAGYPLRLGEVDCAYYMQTGTCKFGTLCKFNHPQATAVSTTMQAGTGSFSAFPSWSLLGDPSVPGVPMQSSCYASFFVPPQGSLVSPGWTAYQGQMRQVIPIPHLPMNQNMFGETAIYGPGSRSIHTSYSPYTVGSPACHLVNFPKRPGQPECKHYMKTGNCKFGALCHFDHPKRKILSQPDGAFRFQALPQRPGTQPCAYYMQYGTCKFGLTCRFDHPTTSFTYHSLPQSLMNCTYPQRLAFPRCLHSSMNTLATGHVQLSEKDDGTAVISEKSEVVESGELRDSLEGGNSDQGSTCVGVDQDSAYVSIGKMDEVASY